MGAGTNGANPMASISVLTELLGVGSWAPTLGMTALVPAMRAGDCEYLASRRRPTQPTQSERTSISANLGH